MVLGDDLWERARWMNLLKFARKLAESANGKNRVVALCLDKRGRIVSSGVNSYTKSHPRQAAMARMEGQDGKIYLHAEVRAILRAGSTPYKIFVARFNKTGNARLAAPCAICRRMIQEAGIKLTEYTT